ncbi:MAG: hypothetical protein VB053_05505 [Oscillibacter ruminantium]|uniref:hypothetical protein n=1 Tax=Oscillibacter ruminantium TaxID=1263547 RepID=UPI002B1FAFD0|nr:hypothetical protein [Oscillibacter ruminantium]MEA5041981.1 hypothetical protein [Oscillibacter ruminantium]
MALQVLEMVLPVAVMLLLGKYCSYRKLLDRAGLAGIKAVISDLCLPVVLFNAFSSAHYSAAVAVTFCVIYAGFGLALAVGFLLRPLAGTRRRFFPLLVTSAEGGMLGYALYGVLTGSSVGFASVDLGQTVFAYTAFLAALKSVDGQKVHAGELLRNMLRNKCFLGMALGIVVGASGLGRVLLGTSVGGVFTGVISMLTAPTSALVLLVVGYELNLRAELLAPVLKTVFCRLLIMGMLLLGVRTLLMRLIPFDRSLDLALMILYALPAPFIIPLFADVGDDGEYISTSLSVHTLCTMLLFALIAAYALS